MSRRNRERRAANRRKRRQQGSGPGHSAPKRGIPNESWSHRDDDPRDQELERDIVDRLDVLWRNGWQPGELCREAGRSFGSLAGALVPWAVAANRARRRELAVDRRWQAQLDVLTPPGAVPASGWLRHWTVANARDAESARGAAMVLTHHLAFLRPIPMLIPPPGTCGASNIDSEPPPHKVDEALLAKVRALLAQAESTNFPDEADAFTAKAQELITRHAIDDALLSGTPTSGDLATAVRIGIDNPYAEIKSLLAHYVADHLRCRAVWDSRYAMTTLVGMPNDVAAAELLFTSLLVQAQTALQATARTAPPGSRPRSRGFRSSFLLAYAQRVSERLAEIQRYMMERATDAVGDRFLPALAARRACVDRTVDDLFGELAKSTVRSAGDALGWARGQLAADQARLDGGAVGRVKLRLPPGEH